MSIGQLTEDIKKFTRLASQASDAHTAAIFLPTGLLTSASPTPLLTTPRSTSLHPLDGSARECDDRGAGHLQRASIELVGVHSLSPSLVRDCRIQVGNGILGWVAENGRPIHVTPFDMESSTLGIYSESEHLQSLVAVPILVPSAERQCRGTSGVLMCDSRKSPSFSKSQVKQLEEIAVLVSRLLFWALFKKTSTAHESSWDSFATRIAQLTEAIGARSVEVLRLSVSSFGGIEEVHGITFAVHQSEQFARLVQQALPPHFPMARLPIGEMIIALDTMMSPFFQNKITSLARHLNDQGAPFQVAIKSFSAKGSLGDACDIDQILRSPVSPYMTKAAGGSRA